MNNLKVYVDGSGKNGLYCYLMAGSSPHLFKEKDLTNNQAEYKAIIKALEELPNRQFTIYSDSQLAIRQLTGLYQIRDLTLKSLAKKVKELSKNKAINFKWIPREQNLAGKVLEKLV